MNKRRYLLLSVAPLALVLALLAFSPGVGAPQPVAAGADVVPGRYIVILKNGVDADNAAGDLGRRDRFQADIVYRRGVHGFAAAMTAAQAKALARDPSVALVEPDKLVSAGLHTNLFQTVPTGVDRIDADQNPTAHITNAPGATPLNIDVAVIDSGVDTQHPDLNVAGGRGFTGATCNNHAFEDNNGHGTHVAGTIAAKDDDRGVVGVAPGARIWGVKVLDANGSGTDSCVIAGIDWVTDRRAEFNDGPSDGDPGIDIRVANMSLGGDDSPAICAAIDNSVAAGVIYAVAAGNGAADDSNFSPANCPSAIAVSAFADFDGRPGDLADPSPAIAFSTCNQSKDDYWACFSSFGPAVDIAAPGVNIVSTYIHNQAACGSLPYCYATLSGTSMATPHVAGALALFVLATGYSGPADAADVMAAFTAAGYTRPQDSSCGFGGDPDSLHEPVLYVGSGCPVDSDGDGVHDLSDNCPAVANPGQENNVHPATPAGDACEDPDADGIVDATDNCPNAANATQQNMVHPMTPAGDACEDPDADGVVDATDNCPSAANAGQSDGDGDGVGDACDNCPTVATVWVVPSGDSDCDGFTTTLENFVGTDPNALCAATSTPNNEPLPDAWPVDFNDDQQVTLSDVLHYTLVFNTTQGGPPGLGGGSYAVRYDLNGDGKINLPDILHFTPYFNKSCKP